jgi:dTDP-4-amino-4,6-dideoxygalactose transaminase
MTRAFGVRHCLFVSSGRAGMVLLLKALRSLADDPRRDEVIIPGYTCYSVAASVERAGLRLGVCDVDARSLSYDLERLAARDLSRTLAVVTANLYGIPDALPQIERTIAGSGALLIDDAAQALGARIEGRYSGTFGAGGVYSFDKGKNITSIQGGVIVTNDDRVAEAVSREIQALPASTLPYVFSHAAKLLAYALLLPPTRYWLTQRLPFLGLGRTPYTTDYPIARYSAFLGAMALVLFREFEDITRTRVDNAERIKRSCKTSGASCIEAPASSKPVYARLPVLLDDPARRASLLAGLDAAGIGASASYPSAIADIAELSRRLDDQDRDTPQARSVAERIVTLPTHGYLRDRHIERLHDTLDKHLR